MAKSRKAKTQAKKAARNARIEASYGSKKALKKALREENPRLIPTDAEAERIINKLRSGQASARDLLPTAKRAERERAASYQATQKKKAASARKATEKRIENKGYDRLAELRERDEGAAKHRLHWLKEHGKKPAKVWSDGTVQLSKNMSGDWITMLGYSERYDSGDKVVMFTMPVYDKIRGVKRYRPGFEGWESMSPDEKKQAIEEKFHDLTDTESVSGTLTAFYVAKEREKSK